MGKIDLTIPEAYRGHLRVGTCSWKYDSWKGLVYRAGVNYGPNDYLPDYAKHFNTVEVDQWFWSLFPPGVKLPDEATVRAYAESVPDDFLFTVKAAPPEVVCYQVSAIILRLCAWAALSVEKRKAFTAKALRLVIQWRAGRDSNP